MFKILIVDDEVFVRMGIKMALQTETDKFFLVGEASNGNQALNIIERTHPDIVITDIKMPEMDGVTLIKEISSRFPAIKCLVLSNYDDFKYVKEAMKYGAEDYFLKATIETEKIIEVLNNMCEKMKEDEQCVSISSNVENAVNNKNNPAWKIRFLAELVKSNSDEDEIKKFIKSAGLRLFSNEGFILLLNVEEYYTVVKERFNGDNNFFSTTMDNILEGVINSEFTGELFEYKPGYYIVIISNNEEGAKDNEDIWLAERIIKAAKDFLSMEIKVICGINFDSFTILKNTISQAREIREIAFYEKEASILSYRDKVRFSTMTEELYELKKSLQIYIRYMDGSKFETAANRMLEIIERDKLKPSILKSVLISVVNYMEEEIRTMGNGDVNINGLETVNKFINQSSFNGLKKAFTQFNYDIKHKMEDFRRNYLRPEIMKGIEYIEKNYMGKVSLEEAANIVSMNRSYFSKLFKSEMGVTFLDYLIKLRMEKAKDLLLNSNMKISDIAEKVGYTNIFYFDRYFKSYYDMTPGEARKNHHIN